MEKDSVLQACTNQNKQIFFPVKESPRDLCAQNNEYEDFKSIVKQKTPSNQSTWIENYVKSFTKIMKKAEITLTAAEVKAAFTLLVQFYPKLLEEVIEIWHEAGDKEFYAGNIRYATESSKIMKIAIKNQEELLKESLDLINMQQAAFGKVGQVIGNVASTVWNSDLINDSLGQITDNANIQEKVQKYFTEGSAVKHATIVASISVDVVRTVYTKGTYIYKSLSQHHQILGSLAAPYILSMLFGDTAAKMIGSAAGIATMIAKSVDTASSTKESNLGTLTFQELIVSFNDVLKTMSLTGDRVTSILAHTLVAATCPVWKTTETDESQFTVEEDIICVPLLYFLNYAAAAYCVTVQGSVEEAQDCRNRWEAINRRTVPIVVENSMDIAREGFKGGMIMYFIAFDLAVSAYVVSFQGTTNLNDFLIDITANAEPFTFTDCAGSADECQKPLQKVDGFAHSGMLRVAKTLVEKIQQELLTSHKFARHFPIICTGHSLGAGVAVLVALQLRKRGFYAYAVGIATPAVLSPSIAKAIKPICVSVINRTDVVPRASERSFCNLGSKTRECDLIPFVKSLICPGEVYWMRVKSAKLDEQEEQKKVTVEKEEEKLSMEIVKLKETSDFSQSIIIETSLHEKHFANNYLKSMQNIYTLSVYDAPDIQLNLLFSDFPTRKLEPEFIIASLPLQIRKTILDYVEQVKQQSKTAKEKELELEKTKKELAVLQQSDLELEKTKKELAILRSEQSGKLAQVRASAKTSKQSRQQPESEQIQLLQQQVQQLNAALLLGQKEAAKTYAQQKDEFEAKLRAECEVQKAELTAKYGKK